MNFYPLVVSDIVDETSYAKSFTFKLESKYQLIFKFQAGQFLSLRLPWEDSYLDRCYSLSNSPDEAQLTITVKRIKDGRASNHLNDSVQVGDIVDIAPPSGRFIASQHNRPLTLFAAGSGITPIISIIRYTLANSDLAISLFYANSNEKQIMFNQSLAKLAQCYPERFNCYHHLSGDVGRVSDETITGFVSEPLTQDFFICGPGSFMDIIESSLLKLGVANQNIATERFIADTESISNNDLELTSNIKSFTAILDGEEHTVPYLAGKTLLDSLLAYDLKPAYFCQKARCGMCTVTKTAGEIIMRNSDILSSNDKETDKILLCQSIAMSDDVSVNCDAE